MRSNGLSGLLLFPVPQVFRKIGQSHEDDTQSGHIDDLDLGVKHAREDHGKAGTQDGPDDENVKLSQVYYLRTGWPCFNVASGYSIRQFGSRIMGRCWYYN